MYTTNLCETCVMDIAAAYNNQLDIQSLLINSSNELSRKNNGNDIINRTADYAKKGEPMYIADMDSDDDGTVTLDEFKDYCKDKGINTREMIKMSQMASAFRTMEAESQTIDYISKLIPNISPKLKQTHSESSHFKQADKHLNASDDNKKAGYEEYSKYGEKNSVSPELKANTKIEKTENGSFKITNQSKAINSYKHNNEHAAKSNFEFAV